MQKTLFFTKQGYEQKQKEYQDLLKERPHGVKELARAREMGDLSENGYYKSARMKLSDIDRRLRQLRYILKIGRIKEKTNSSFVDIGSSVTIQINEQKKTYEIVGTYEASPSQGKISSLSPLGKVLIGKMVGESVVFTAGEKKTTISIVSIS